MFVKCCLKNDILTCSFGHYEHLWNPQNWIRDVEGILVDLKSTQCSAYSSTCWDSAFNESNGSDRSAFLPTQTCWGRWPCRFLLKIPSGIFPVSQPWCFPAAQWWQYSGLWIPFQWTTHLLGHLRQHRGSCLAASFRSKKSNQSAVKNNQSSLYIPLVSYV